MLRIVAAVAAWILGVAFTAGCFYIYVRMSLSNLESLIQKNNMDILQDLSGIGRKVTQNEENASRRYHNLSLAIMNSCPAEKENEISHLMKEEATN